MVDSIDQTALTFATLGGHVEVVRELFKSDPNFTDERGHRPLYYAAQGGHLECVTALIHAGAEVTSLRGTTSLRSRFPSTRVTSSASRSDGRRSGHATSQCFREDSMDVCRDCVGVGESIASALDVAHVAHGSLSFPSHAPALVCVCSVIVSRVCFVCFVTVCLFSPLPLPLP